MFTFNRSMIGPLAALAFSVLFVMLDALLSAEPLADSPHRRASGLHKWRSMSGFGAAPSASPGAIDLHLNETEVPVVPEAVR